MTVNPPVPRLSIIVPTLGLSPWLTPCLEALRRDAGDEAEILLVCQGEIPHPSAEKIADRVLRLGENLGFAAANNAGLAVARGDYLATVNDDAIVEGGWCDRLLDALDQYPMAAAAQGFNLSLHDPTVVDGGGLAWNRAWQAVQIAHGLPREGMPAVISEIFGVSATAAIYRRAALARIAVRDREMFDSRLFAYYEDVDLACRLRSAGYSAVQVPLAQTRHAGSLSGQQLPGGNAKWIYGNRQLVLARLLGRSFWPRWPRILLRDLADVWQATRRGDGRTASGIVVGGFRFLRHWPSFAHLGPPEIGLRELRRFRITTPPRAHR